jgi:hypothetical protein
MSLLRYAIYPPAEPGLPYLAVVLDGPRLLDTFACPDRQSATEVLGQMRARHSGRTGGWADQVRPTQPVEFASLYRFQPEAEAPKRAPAALPSQRTPEELHGETGERASSSRRA